MMNYIEKIKKDLEKELFFGRAYSNIEFNQIVNNFTILILVKGIYCTNEDIHSVWSVFTNEKDKSHSCLRPFKNNSKKIQDYDTKYKNIVVEIAKKINKKREANHV